MLRQFIVTPSRRLPRATRLFATTARSMAEGDTGAPRHDGISTAWSKREKGNEDMYVRQQERAKLQMLKAKLAEQRKNIADLERDVEAMAAEQDKLDAQGKK